MLFRKKKKIVYTITALGNLANEEHIARLPLYKRKGENGFIVQPRGLIFVKRRKKKKYHV